MDENHHYLSLYGKPPVFQLLVAMLVILGAGVVLFLISIFAGLLVFDYNLETVEKISASPDIQNIGFLRYLMISQELALFIIPSVIILALLKPAQPFSLKGINVPGVKDIGLVVILAFCIFPITSFTGQLNAGMDLPDWFSGVERWMITKEEDAESLINLLIISDTFRTMILNLVMIALLPAIGEELLFRGVFQKIFCKFFRSDHWAVWITAILFSAIHFQFFGFIPRLILGLVFGYLYLWSGTLWLPVIAHFMNNAVPVIGAYISGWDKINTLPDMSIWKQLLTLPLPVIVSLAILYYFRKAFRERSEQI